MFAIPFGMNPLVKKIFVTPKTETHNIPTMTGIANVNEAPNRVTSERLACCESWLGANEVVMG